MTRQNETSYRKKGLSVFLTVLMVLSVVAMSATMIGTVAAVDEPDPVGGPADIGVGIDGVTQNVTADNSINVINASDTIDLQSVDFNISLSDLDDNGVDISEIGNNTIEVEGESHEGGGTPEAFSTDNVDIEVDDDADENYFNFTVELDGSGDADNISELNVKSLEFTNLDTSDASAATGLTYDIEVTGEETNSAETPEFALVAQEVTVGDLAIAPGNATIVSDSGEELNDLADRVAFNQNITVDDVEIGGDTDGEVVFDFSELRDHGANATAADNLSVEGDLAGQTVEIEEFDGDNAQVIFNVSNDANDPITGNFSFDLHVDGEDITDNADERVFYSANGADDDLRLIGTGTVTADAETPSISDNDVWEGQTITVETEEERDTIQVWNITEDTDLSAGELGDEGEEVVWSTGTAPGEARNVDTSELGEGNYTITQNNEIHTEGDFYFEVAPLDLEVSADDVDDNEDLIAEATSEDVSGEWNLEFKLINDDDEVEQTITRSLGGDGDATANFGTVDAGEYEVEVVHEPSEVSATDDVTVGEAPEIDADVSFGDIDDQAEGDVVEILLEFENAEEYGEDDVHVRINESDYGAEFAVDLSEFDHDELVIEWNTYYAGKSTIAADDVPNDNNDNVLNATNESVDLTITHETNVSENFRLNPAGYTLGVFDDGGDFDNRIDSASVTVTERSTGDSTVHIAPSQHADDEFEHIFDNATERNEVAEGDLLIVEQEIDGIFGYAITDDGEFSDEAGIDITFENTEAPAYAEATTFNLSESDDLYMVADADEGVLYFVLDVEEEDLEEGDVQEWEVSFNVSDDNAYIDEDDEESTLSAYDVIHRMTEVDYVEEPYQVTPTEDAVIEGVSTLAPGTNVTVEVDKPGVFLHTDDTVQVDADGDWVYTADYSDREVDEEFDITITVDGVVTHEIDGVFNATPEADTTTSEQDLQAIVDELTDLLDVEQDEIVSTVEQLIEDAEDAEELAAQVEQLQAQLSEAQEDAQTWETLYDGAVEDLEAAEDDLEQAQADLEQAESDLSDAQDEIDSLESDLSAAEDEISDLEDQIDDLQADDDDGVPGFGPIAALFALLAGGALVARRRL